MALKDSAKELSKRGHAVRWKGKTAEEKRQATEAARAARWKGKK